MSSTGKRHPARGAASHARTRDARELRIVGGEWRGRRFRFPGGVEIRPTPDRVRETLFNWLMNRVAGRRVLDLFAGSGALGLEALSRGAASATFVERDSRAARALRDTLDVLGAPLAQVFEADALRWLAGPARAHDLVFLDPPYGAGLLTAAAERLEEGWLADQALVYVEHAVREPLADLPRTWNVVKSGRAGEVGYHLCSRTSSRAASE